MGLCSAISNRVLGCTGQAGEGRLKVLMGRMTIGVRSWAVQGSRPNASLEIPAKTLHPVQVPRLEPTACYVNWASLNYNH